MRLLQKAQLTLLTAIYDNDNKDRPLNEIFEGVKFLHPSLRDSDLDYLKEKLLIDIAETALAYDTTQKGKSIMLDILSQDYKQKIRKAPICVLKKIHLLTMNEIHNRGDDVSLLNAGDVVGIYQNAEGGSNLLPEVIEAHHAALEGLLM